MSGRIKQILFVCTGNICRSPFAEGLLKKLLQKKGLDDVVADSAGLLALPGNSASGLAQKVAAEYDVDLSGHVAKSVNEDIVDRSDLILVMEKAHEESLLDAFPEAEGKVFLIRRFARFGSNNRGIADPYGLNYEAYRFCFLDIQDCIIGLAEYLSGRAFIFEPIEVVSYEGYKANESPRSFEWAGRNFKVVKIVDRWYEGGLGDGADIKDYFRVNTDDGDTHIIRYNRLSDDWAIRKALI
jgi:protein-tyrosine phosphatase